MCCVCVFKINYHKNWTKKHRTIRISCSQSRSVDFFFRRCWFVDFLLTIRHQRQRHPPRHWGDFLSVDENCWRCVFFCLNLNTDVPPYQTFFWCFYGFQTSIGKMRGFVEMLSDNLLSPEIRETALLTKTFCQLSHEKTLVGWVI